VTSPEPGLRLVWPIGEIADDGVAGQRPTDVGERLVADVLPNGVNQRDHGGDIVLDAVSFPGGRFDGSDELRGGDAVPDFRLHVAAVEPLGDSAKDCMGEAEMVRLCLHERLTGSLQLLFLLTRGPLHGRGVEVQVAVRSKSSVRMMRVAMMSLGDGVFHLWPGHADTIPCSRSHSLA
jgi:hypothetical protein